MPGLTLRLTDEQHAQLEREAALNRRSLQGEIIYRLFPPWQTGPHPGYESEQAERHFKPDPKPSKAEKRGRR